MESWQRNSKRWGRKHFYNITTSATMNPKLKVNQNLVKVFTIPTQILRTTNQRVKMVLYFSKLSKIRMKNRFFWEENLEWAVKLKHLEKGARVMCRCKFAPEEFPNHPYFCTIVRARRDGKFKITWDPNPEDPYNKKDLVHPPEDFVWSELSGDLIFKDLSKLYQSCWVTFPLPYYIVCPLFFFFLAWICPTN